MPNSAKEIVFRRVLDSYRRQITDETFNGIKLQEIDSGLDNETLRLAIIELVNERKLDIVSSATDINPHIKRHSVQNIEVQLQKLDVNEKYHTCLYPTVEIIAQEFDLNFLTTKPFSKEIARGHPELEPVFFEIGVLDRYRLDPRYSFHCYEYAGRLSISSSDNLDSVPERDRTFLETFGLALDGNANVYVCVFLRYLSQMTPEHQRHWQSHIAHRDDIKMHINYYKRSYLGEFYTNNSAVAAIRISIETINEVCEAVWRKTLFNNPVPEDVHYNLSPFMRPTRADYLSFVHELGRGLINAQP